MLYLQSAVACLQSCMTSAQRNMSAVLFVCVDLSFQSIAKCPILRWASHHTVEQVLAGVLPSPV